jgi:hypothetical protein
MSVRSLLPFVLLIALVFAPICGMGGAAEAAAMGERGAAHHRMMADASHCADMGGGRSDESSNGVDIDCRMACAGVLSPTPLIAEAPVVVSVPRHALFVVLAPGRNPTADPPPPRLS